MGVGQEAVDRESGGAVAAPAEIRRALEAVLASETFRNSANLAAFLRFVVEATLRGEQDRIKGYTIGVEALGRSQDFDPQTDPIVRVEATRLRRALVRYNATEGAADPITFALSRGSYVPVIRRQAPSVGPAAGNGPQVQTPHVAVVRRRPGFARSRPAQAAFAAVAIIVVAAAALLLMHGTERTGSILAPRPRDTQSFDGPLQPGNGMPTLSVLPISILGLPPAPGVVRPQVSFAGPMTERLRATLARFDTVNVMGDVLADGGDGPPPAAQSAPAVDYQLIGSGELTRSGGMALRFRLVDAAAGTTIWSRDFDVPTMSTDYSVIEEQIVAQLAQTLAPPFGVIRANERVRQLAGEARDPRYRCMLEASESFRSLDPDEHRRARACLEALTARDPAFALGFSYLGSILKREYQFGLGARPIDADLLDQALRAAQRGIELSPESARAYQMLSSVLFQRRDIAASFAAIEKAIALNNLDMTILSDYGGQLVMAGEVQRGLEALGRAADEGTVRPSWYRFYLFLGHYLENDARPAAEQAALVPADVYPLGPLARTLASILEGHPAEARAAFEQLAAGRPSWRAQAREELTRMFPSPAAERMLRDIVAAGLAPG